MHLSSVIGSLQGIGRALMLPIAVLPVAALLLRLGQPDLLNIAFISAAGDAIFANLGLLFAIGVGVGLSRDGHGAAALAGVVCFLVSTKGAEQFVPVPSDLSTTLASGDASLLLAAYRAKAIAGLSVPMGILSGVIAGLAYNRYAGLKLPEYLAFFGGKRFVPIVCGFSGVLLALLIGSGYELLSHGMDAMSRGIAASGEFGLFIYGVLNRLLIVTGLHHILNNIAWFVVGEYQGVTGDLTRFFAGDPNAGSFMSGFFPVMMFGLPAACLAMYHSVPTARRAATGGMLASLALTSLLTGVTEPVEFSFMFVAPLLYALHALLTGLAMPLMDMLGVKLGFGFSAGLFDYLLNFNKATNPLLLLPVGAVYALIYYGLFRAFISAFNLATPGRFALETSLTPAEPQSTTSRTAALIAALGGAKNLVSVSACTTRLRLIVASQSVIDEAQLTALGSRGLVRPSQDSLQVVLGPEAELVAEDIQQALRSEKSVAAMRTTFAAEETAINTPDHLTDANGGDWLQALGGAANLIQLEQHSSRLRLALSSTEKIDGAALTALGVRTWTVLPGDIVHLIIGTAAASVATAIDAARDEDRAHSNF